MEILGQLSIMRYTVGGTNEHREFIVALREKLARRKDGCIGTIKVGELSPAVLPNLDELNKQDLLLHIELRAKKQNSNESWTTTLAMRKDNLYIVGFTGKDGKWFELAESGCPLPKEYHSTPLHWNVRYKSIMNLKDQDQVKRTLSNTRLGMAFAIRAVRRLSQYSGNYDCEDDNNVTGLGLAGLIVVICESAKMETIRKETQSFEWGRKGIRINKTVLDYIWDWGTVSAALMRWKKHAYKEEYAGDARLLRVVDNAGLCLVLNSENVEGGARVEIFAVSANFDVTSIIVTDANGNDCTIYNHKGRVTPTKNKLFVTWNIGVLQQDYVQTIIEMAVQRYSLQISNIMMGLIIIQFPNENFSNSEEFMQTVRSTMSHELEKKIVTISQDDPRNNAKGMVDLELNNVGISGYKWFDFVIKSPGCNSQDAVATEPVTRRWRLDCRKQVGNGTEVVTCNIAFDSQRKMDVTYLVMSDAVKAKVDLTLWYPGDPSYLFHTERAYKASMHTVHGEIAARIDGFDNHRIVLFRISDKSEAKRLARGSTLPLERSDIWVPRGKRVHIEMKHLHVTTCRRKVVRMPDRLSFDFGQFSQSSGDNDSKVTVHIAWDGIPQKESLVKQPDVQWIVSDDAQVFTERIEELRAKVVVGNNDTHVLEGYRGKDDLKNRPILANLGGYFIETKGCVHIEVQAEKEKKKKEKETWSTTLAVRDEKCSGVGFMNQSGVWYDLGYSWAEEILPAKYNSVLLGWGVDYNQILQASDWREELNKAGKMFTTTKDFVMNAVGTLSRYPDVEDGGMNPRIAVVALMIVCCESAKLDFVHKSFARDWGTKVEFTKEIKDHVSTWEEMSRTLVHWKYHFYRSWPQSSELERINITSERLALEAVHLVLNRRALLDQFDVTYTIEDDIEGYRGFIEELRRKVTGHPYGRGNVGVLPARSRDGPMWWNIQLKAKVEGKREISTILALRGHDLRICGFRSQDGYWYQDCRASTSFDDEYDALPLAICGMYRGMCCWPAATYGGNAARSAVWELSEYSYNIWEDEMEACAHLYSPLRTLQLMVTDSASINKVHDAVVHGWGRENKKPDQNLLNLRSFWQDRLSKRALEQWERCGGDSPPWDDQDTNKLLEANGIKTPQDALEVFALIQDAS